VRAALHVLLLVVALLPELVVLTACAVAAYRWPDGLALQVSAAVVAPLLMGLLRGLYAAPRAARRLTGPASGAFRTAWSGIGVLAIAWVLGPLAGAVLGAVSLVDALGLHVLGRAPGR